MWHKRITLALAVLAVLFLATSGPGTRAGLWPFWVGVGMFAGALLAGLAAVGAAVPLDYIRRVKGLPYINDITTDTERPPQFSPPKAYESHFAELQQIGYPDLRPLALSLPPKQAFARAADTARGQGWEITALDESAGRIEAVATTRWFGFKDDVVVRITPAGTGSRVDMRSKSRLGRSDAGANARRIREFLAHMDARE